MNRYDSADYEIPCAGDRNLWDGASSPQMGQTIMGYFRPLTLTKILTRIVNNQTSNDEIPIQTRGATQPFSVTRLDLKPEGERTWEWVLLYCVTALTLDLGDVVRINTKLGARKFRVMGRKDYSQEGFLEYELCNDYTNRT